MTIPAEILKKVKYLEIKTRKIVNNLFAGEYHSKFKGQGMIFRDFREYIPGDEVRSISWPLFARTGKPYIKQFEEEREQTLVLAVDVSGSHDFGTGDRFKGEVINWVSALLAFSAQKNNDQVSLLLFSDQIENYVPPKKGRHQVQRILRDLLYFKPKSSKTQIRVGVEHLLGVLKKRSAIFILSDFMDEGYERSLRMLGQKHDVLACVISDPSELKLPNLGLVDWQDSESGEILTVDTSSEAVQTSYRNLILKQIEKRDKALRAAGVDRVDLTTVGDVTNPLIDFFRRRK